MYKTILMTVAGAALLGSAFFLWGGGKRVTVHNNVSPEPVVAASETEAVAQDPAGRNPLTGEICPGGDLRPMAVMLAADHVARPLSGIAEADVVVEMPALTGGITRYMAVYACGRPEEIGATRSARHDFLPFAKSFDAVYAHWGGSYLALDILKQKVIDNVNALTSPAFYRVNDRPAPHNGFTSFAMLREAAHQAGYRMENKATGYIHIADGAVLSIDQDIAIGYPAPYHVRFSYHHAANAYLRFRGGEKELDVATGRQVEVKNVVVMFAESHQVNPDYNDVAVEGEGDAMVYRNGQELRGKWKRAPETYENKDGAGEKYFFYDALGKEIGFVPGKIWIAVVQPNQKVSLTVK
ncbi:MAG: DUF3048 domain-containing protein [Patescibacteria group bacterium]